MEVYRAIRRRQLKIPTRLPVLSVNEGLRRVKMFSSNQGTENRTDNDGLSLDVDGPVLPGCDVEYIKIQISCLIDVGHFWAQNYDDQTTSNLCYIQKELNKSPLRSVQSRVEVGGLYAALYKDKFYYRCRVVSINHTNREGITAQVMMIKYYPLSFNNYIF